MVIPKRIYHRIFKILVIPGGDGVGMIKADGE
jgi:hypothetical protein